MPVFLQKKLYLWLREIAVFQSDPIKTVSQDLCQVPFEQEQYLRNGYLIAVALKKFVKLYSDQYQQLLRVRKIATIKSSQNWEIIESFLNKLGCDFEVNTTKNNEVEISEAKIAEILNLIYLNYCSDSSQRSRITKKRQNSFFDYNHFRRNKPLKKAENSLQLFCLVLVEAFDIKLSQALGLLTDQAKYLKKLVVEGSKFNQFQSVKKFYEILLQAWPLFHNFIEANPQQINFVLEGLSEGVSSQNKGIVTLTLNILSLVQDQQWFEAKGYYKLFLSSEIESFSFGIEKLRPHYGRYLNTSLHLKIKERAKLLKVLQNMIRFMPKTIYFKQMLPSLPISYFYQRCLQILAENQFEKYTLKEIMFAKEIITRLIKALPQDIPIGHIAIIGQAFEIRAKRNQEQTYHTLVNLLEIIQSLMERQSEHLQVFFLILMRYVQETSGEIKFWILNNLTYIYNKNNKYFPLGCCLSMFVPDLIGQASQFSLFELFCSDIYQITQYQSRLIISFVLRYIQTQIHCRCFVTLLKKLFRYHSQSSKNPSSQILVMVLKKITDMKIPTFVQGYSDIVNPAPPQKSRVIHSIGLKRKQMIKINEYQAQKQVISTFLQFSNKQALLNLIVMIKETILGIEKQVGHKKKQLVHFLKDVKSKARKKFESIAEKQSMNELTKSILINRSTVSRTIDNELKDFTPSLAQSKIFYSQSQFLMRRNTEVNWNSIIKQQVEEQNENLVNNSKDEPKKPQIIGNQSHIFLKEFTDEGSFQQRLIFVEKDHLESYQLSFMQLSFEKYPHIMPYCSQIYQQLQKVSNAKQISGELVDRLGLKKIISCNLFQEVLTLCRKSSKNTDVLIENLLMNISFQVFSFKQNRRISITGISSLLGIIHDNLSENDAQYGKRAKIVDKRVMKKNILMQNEISVKIVNSNDKPSLNQTKGKATNFIECFQILSSIFFEGLGVHLLEPLSKQVTSFLLSEKQSQLAINSKNVQEQLKLLEEKLMEQEQICQNQIKKKDNRDNRNPKQSSYKSSKFAIDKGKTEGISRKDNELKGRDTRYKEDNEESSVSLNSNSRDTGTKLELKNKLMMRVKILNQDLKKIQKKKVSNNQTSPGL